MSKTRSTRLVLLGVRVRKSRGSTAEESQLDGYRVTCLLEQVDDKEWRATAQLHLTDETRAEKKFRPETLKARGRNVTLNERDAKEAAEAYIIRSMQGILSSMFNMRRVEIGLFGPVMWKDGTNFRFR